MKQIALVLIGWVLSVATAFAQVEFGVRAGGAYSSLIQQLDKTYESGGRLGFSVAGLMQVPIYKGLSFVPEVGLIYQGGDYYTYPIGDEMGVHNFYKYYSLQVPLDLAYTFQVSDVRLIVFAGPTLDFSFAGKMKSKETGVETDIQFDKKEEPNLRTVDLGINVGLSVEYNRFFFSISNVAGVLDRRTVKRKDESLLFQNNVTFSIGYFFRRPSHNVSMVK